MSNSLRPRGLQASLSLTIFRSLPKFMSIAWVMPSCHLILCRPLLLRPSLFPSIRAFSNKLSFSFSISPSNEYSGLISLKFDWFDLLAVQGTFRSLLQHHSSKASILWHSAFFTIQFSQPCVTTGKAIDLSIRTFVGRVMSLFFSTLSSLSELSCQEESSSDFMAVLTICSDFRAKEEEVCHYFHL